MNFSLRIRPPDGWTVSTILAAALVAVPVAAILAESFRPSGEVMGHLASTLMTRLVLNTAVLAGGVAVLTSIIGVSFQAFDYLCLTRDR